MSIRMESLWVTSSVMCEAKKVKSKLEQEPQNAVGNKAVEFLPRKVPSNKQSILRERLCVLTTVKPWGRACLKMLEVTLCTCMLWALGLSYIIQYLLLSGQVPFYCISPLFASVPQFCSANLCAIASWKYVTILINFILLTSNCLY